MIDTHCHVLPGFDDGPADEDESLALARMLVADGIVSVVCTPHYSTRFPTDDAAAGAALDRLRARFEEARLTLTLGLAAEIDPVAALDAPLDALSRRSLAGRFLIVEVTSDVTSPFFGLVAERIAGAGLTPIFAHPERNRAVQRSLEPLAAARAAGALVQIVAPSLLGRWGSRSPRARGGWSGAGSPTCSRATRTAAPAAVSISARPPRRFRAATAPRRPERSRSRTRSSCSAAPPRARAGAIPARRST